MHSVILHTLFDTTHSLSNDIHHTYTRCCASDTHAFATQRIEHTFKTHIHPSLDLFDRAHSNVFVSGRGGHPRASRHVSDVITTPHPPSVPSVYTTLVLVGRASGGVQRGAGASGANRDSRAPRRGGRATSGGYSGNTVSVRVSWSYSCTRIEPARAHRLRSKSYYVVLGRTTVTEVTTGGIVVGMFST